MSVECRGGDRPRALPRREIRRDASALPGKRPQRQEATLQTEPEIPPAITRTHVFGDLRPFSQCHASTLVARGDGGVFVAWFAGTYEGHRDVGIWAASSREARAGELGPGSAFEAPRLIAKIGDEPHWNPVLFTLGGDPDELVLHFKVGSSIRRWVTFMQRSHDGGQSWSEARPLVPGDRGGRGAVRCKPIQLRSGAWLAGASVERWRRWDAFMDRSPDGISGWEATERIAIDRQDFEGKGLIQPALWESAPGCIHALLRSTDGRVHRSDSDDDGRSWSKARPIDVPNNNSGLDVLALDDETLVLACNPVAGNWAARTPLSLLLSQDGGETWPARIDIEREPGEFSYPALVSARVGSEPGLALSYTWNRRRISVARIPSRTLAASLAAALPGPSPAAVDGSARAARDRGCSP